MTVAELIEKLSALSDKTARVVKSPGPWDGLNEPSLRQLQNASINGYLLQDRADFNAAATEVMSQ